MSRKKPCRICRRWFEPHPRAGARQRACSNCQSERHRRSCADWHAKNPGYDKKRRLRASARLDDAADADEPMDAVLWPVIEDAIGPAHRTVIEAIARLLLGITRDAVTSKGAGQRKELDQQLNRRSRDAVALTTGLAPRKSGEVHPVGRETQPADQGPDP
jgi:hypothetical protein